MKPCISMLAALALLPVSGVPAGAWELGVASTDPVASDTLRIAVAATGPAADAVISTEAARAPYILIFDHRGELVEAMENRDVPAQRAGAQVALALKERGVTHYIAGRFGRNLINALEAADIERLERTGSANEAVKQLIVKRPALQAGDAAFVAVDVAERIRRIVAHGTAVVSTLDV